MTIDRKASVAARADSTLTTGPRADLDKFLADLGRSPTPGVRGRLVFALDATASRQPTWDTAVKLQADMFREAGAAGGLDMQLVYYRGLGECRASRWLSNSAQLAKTMSSIMCNAGETQIEKVLAHVRKEAKLFPISALVFVGDAMEENPDALIHEARELGQLKVPVFMFQEGRDPDVEQVFRDIAQVTHGAYCRFDPGSARQLAELLRAVTAFVVGGIPALAARKDAGAVKLLGQLK